MSCSSSLGGDSSYDAPDVYGTAGGTGRVLACVRGPPRQPRCARRRSHRGRLTTRRSSRGDVRRLPPLQHVPASHRSDIHTSRAVRQGVALYTLRSCKIHAAPLAPASKQHEAQSVQVSMVEISRPPKVTATCGARVYQARPL
jgi:hypothetical protein